MSQQQYARAASALGTIDPLLREQYFPEVMEQVWRNGSITNQLFQPATDLIASGDGITVQVLTGHSDSARASRNALKDFGNARQVKSQNVKIRFEDDPSAASTGSDFVRTEVVGQLTELELKRGNDPGVALNLAEKVNSDLTESVMWKKPLMYYSDVNGKFAAVNGTKKNNDSDTFADATTYTAGATSFRVPVDYGSVSAFIENTHWDFYSGDTLLADECRVTDFNPVDLSVGFALTDASTVANCDSVADNADIYVSGEKGNGYRCSLREFFDAPSASESWIGGVDRTSADYRWLNPTRLKATASGTVKVDRNQMDTLALAMNYINDGKDMGNSIISSSAIIQTLRKDIGEEALSNQAASNDGAYSFGQDTISYIHPVFGKVRLLADNMHPNDRMHFIRPGDWKLIPYLSAGLQQLAGDTGNWYRESAASGGGGRGMYWRTDAYMLDTPFCMVPKKQGVLLNISA